MIEAKNLSAADLFVLLERAFRRRRECHACAFTLPFRTAAAGPSNWSVIPSHACSEPCRLVLEQLVAEHQACYRLAD